MDENLKKQLKDGKGLTDKLARGKDVSDMMARAMLKHDQMQAMERAGGYVLRDGYGRPTHMMTPHGLVPIVGAGNPMAPQPYMQPPGSMIGQPGPSLGSLNKSKSPGDAFRNIGAAAAKSNQAEDEALEKLKQFISTISAQEKQNLKDLCDDRVIIKKSLVEETHAKGEELGVERLIDLNLIKYENVEDMIEFRITTLGRKVYSSL